VQTTLKMVTQNSILFNAANCVINLVTSIYEATIPIR
jgi:hypothetical protein